MIHTICQLHYLSESTYHQLAGPFGLDKPYRSIGENHVDFTNAPIQRLHFFNIRYQSFGHVWFMRVTTDYQLFRCGREEFIPKLYEAYAGLFGEGSLRDVPGSEDVNCDYVEYGAMLDVGDAGAALTQLRGSLQPEQLDKALWGRYAKPHSTVEFLAEKADSAHLEILARCHGPALKRLVKDTSLHLATGLRLPAAICQETEEHILSQLVAKNMKAIPIREMHL